MTQHILLFYFDYAGGCLWAGDDATRDVLGFGPVDKAFHPDQNGTTPAGPALSDKTRALIEQLDRENWDHLNPVYQPDPSLWSQALCDRFNADLDRLLALLQQDLGPDYRILDEQPRFSEDERLDAYLLQHPDLSKQRETTR